MKFNLAFTLAEILIVVGIVGVVAVMTIPALLNKSQDLELKSALKKEFSVIGQANNLLMNDNGGTLSGITGGYIANIGNYFKYSKYCSGASHTNGCWHAVGESYVYTGAAAGAPTNQPQTNFAGGGYILTDGTLITFYGNWPTGASLSAFSGSSEPVYTELLVDVNGFNKPNVVGRDIFCFFPSNIGLLPYKGTGYQWDNTYKFLLNN